jgi:hypothetical protein
LLYITQIRLKVFHNCQLLQLRNEINNKIFDKSHLLEPDLMGKFTQKGL